MARLFKLHLTHPYPGRRLVRDLLAAVFIFVGSVQAQEADFGDTLLFEVPFGTKIIDVGFKNWQTLNTSTVRTTEHLLLRWKMPDSTINYRLRIGVPKCKLTDKEFGLSPIFESEPECFNWLSSLIDVGKDEKYLLRAAGFDYVVQVVSEDFYYRSQYKLIKQRHK